jgi:uncharacterized protein YoaH (UPF0181 family)
MTMTDIETKTETKPSGEEIKLTSQEVRELDQLAATLVAQGLRKFYKGEDNMSEQAQAPIIMAPKEEGFLDTTAGKVTLAVGAAVVGGAVVYLASGSGSSAVSDIMSR